MVVKLDDELAESMTRPQFYLDSAAAPDVNDFYYKITYGHIDFEVRWSRDLGVTNPKWHIIVLN